MTDEKKQEQVKEDLEVVPINIILGELEIMLEIIKQKLFAHLLVLSTTKEQKENTEGEEVKEVEVEDAK